MLAFLHIVYRRFGWLLFLLLAACSRSSEPVPQMRTVAPIPANPGLIPEGRQLLARLSDHYGKHTLSGQVEYKEEGRYVAADYIQSVSGRGPVIIGLDMMDYSPSRRQFGADPGTLIDDAIDMATNQNRVLTLSWHWNAPMHLLNDDREPWWRAYYANGSEFNLRYALRNPGSSEYKALLRDLDAIGVELKRLAEHNIPVLWRPLHSAEGGWYWWGARGPEAFKELWRLMFVRFTDTHELNNLIWVLTNEDPDWYPGDDVVDIVGVDAYPSDRASTLLENWNDLLRRHNGRKMIALTEFGGVPYVEEMHLDDVWFSYFVTWTDQNRGKLGPKHVPREHLQKVYQSAAVLTLDEWHDSSKADGSNDGFDSPAQEPAANTGTPGVNEPDQIQESQPNP